MNRKMNFFAGPSTMPLEVLEAIQKDIVDYKGNGLSMIEASHRGGMFEEMMNVLQTLGLFFLFQTIMMSISLAAEQHCNLR